MRRPAYVCTVRVQEALDACVAYMKMDEVGLPSGLEGACSSRRDNGIT
jgi:hypothetical protein